jgi:hypothetical protein
MRADSAARSLSAVIRVALASTGDTRLPQWLVGKQDKAQTRSGATWPSESVPVDPET